MGGGRSSYQRQFGGGNRGTRIPEANDTNNAAEQAALMRKIRQQKGEQIDKQFGYEEFEFRNSNDGNNDEIMDRRGWLFNMLPTTVS